MPASVRRTPFGTIMTPSPTPDLALRTPQLNVLQTMRPHNDTDYPIDWPYFTRARLRAACGLSPTNSMNRILHGIKDGPGKHLGLIELGLVEEVALDIEGTIEYSYHITAKGIECLRQYNAARSDRK